MEKPCLCCKKRFHRHPAVPKQRYCSDPECQKTRKRKWQKEKLSRDRDYRANQAEAQRQWRSRNQGYWREYRRKNPAYTERNRLRQRERNRLGRSGSGIAKMDELKGKPVIPSGRYRLVPFCNPRIAKMDELIVDIDVISGGCRFGGGRVMIAKRGLARLWRRAVINFLRMKEPFCREEIAVSEIGERYGAFRIVSPRADAAMVQSIRKYGQISPVVCVKGQGGYELIDGFKRLRACRRLKQSTLKAKTMEVSGRVCKAAIIQLNWSGRSINEMEEALVLQSLHREDGLTQVEIATLLGRDKSWVSRRILLMERLGEEVQEDIRLGLISVITGRELAKLPRGNQKEAAETIFKRRYTTREAAKLIGYLLSRPKWEYSGILASPWEVVEPRELRPRGLGAKLVSFREICQTILEGVNQCNPETRTALFPLLHLAVISAEEVVKTLRTEP